MGPMLEGMTLSPKQLDYITGSTARINAAEGAVRAGKSFGCDIRWLEYTQTQQGPFLMTGKTIDTVQRNIIRPLQELAGDAVRWHNQGRGELMIGTALVHVVGANDQKAESRIRGLTVGGWYADEVTLHPADFIRMAMTRLSIPGSKAFWSMNPDSPYHFVKTEWLDNAELLKSGALKRWHFTLDDNPALDDDYKASLAQMFAGLFHDRFIKGLWVLAEGVIYSQFLEQHHVVLDDQIPDLHTYWVSCDYGTANPCVFLLMGMDATGGIWVVREYYWDSAKKKRQKTDSEYADDLLAWLDGMVPMVIYVDPSAASFITELRKRGWIVMPAYNAVLDGIRTVAKFLSNGLLHLHKSCTNTIQEFASYIWDEAAQKKGEDAPVKQHDHGMDALRYGVFTHTKRGVGVVTDKPAGW
jgi:PBSX family phage terminase large subunit